MYFDSLYVFVLDLRYQLNELSQYKDIDGDSISLSFKSKALMDEVLSDIRRTTEKCGYTYFHETFGINLSTFALERDNKKIFFKIRCYSDGSESEAVYWYSIKPA
jgi:hypothetical protein